MGNVKKKKRYVLFQMFKMWVESFKEGGLKNQKNNLWKNLSISKGQSAFTAHKKPPPHINTPQLQTMEGEVGAIPLGRISSKTYVHL